MPLGAFRLNSLARYVAAAAPSARPVTVTANGNAQIDTAQSQFGRSSALFDGTDDVLIASGDFSQTGDFTMECWARLNSVSGIRKILTIGTEATGRGTLFMDNATLKYDTFGAGGPDITTSATLSTGTWYHVAAVRNGSTLAIYVDGSNVGSITTTATLGNSNNFYIGSDNILNRDFDGHIDEVRVSNIARYTANFTPSTTPFVNDANTLLLLHMDGTDAATDFPDDTGVRQANGVDMQGGAFLDTTDYKFGVGSFNGESTATTTVGKSSYDIAFGTGDFTMEAWVYITTDFSTTATGIINTGTSISDASDIRLGVGAGTNNFTVRLGTTNYLNASFIWSLNTWYHVALTRNSGTCNLWVNGTKDTTVGSSGDMTFTQDCAARQIGIGRITYAGVRCVPGNIDEVRISSVARYTSNFTPSTTAFTNDSDTLMLLHFDSVSTGSIDFYAYDDNS